MRTVRQNFSGAAAALPPVPLSLGQSPFNVSVAFDLTSGTGTFSVQHTYDDVYAPGFDPATATWYAKSDFSGKTGDADAAYTAPVSAVRLLVTVSGTLIGVFTVMQAGI